MIDLTYDTVFKLDGGYRVTNLPLVREVGLSAVLNTVMWQDGERGQRCSWCQSHVANYATFRGLSKQPMVTEDPASLLGVAVISYFVMPEKIAHGDIVELTVKRRDLQLYWYGVIVASEYEKKEIYLKRCRDTAEARAVSAAVIAAAETTDAV